MNIEYIQPLTEAWNRMVQDLFKPFRAGRWFAVGFAVWLVSLSNGGWGNFNFRLPSDDWRDRDFFSAPAQFVERVTDFFSGPFGVALAVGFALGFLLIIVLLLWLGSRAQFVFLDQVTGRHWRIAGPWQRYATQGNSLFLWRIGFGFLLLAVMGLLLGPAIAFLVINDAASFSLGAALAIAWMVLVVFAVVIPASFVHCFLNSFVIPLMYRDGSKTNAAWRRFLPLLRAHIWSFVGYGLFLLALWIAIVPVLFAFSCVICCIGCCLLLLPYLGTVYTLPIPYALRGLGPAFLAQFGPDYWAWPVDDPAGATGTAGPGPAEPLVPQ